MKNIVIGEWLFTKSIFNEINNDQNWYSYFIKPLFNMQNSLNTYARLSLETIHLEAFDDRSVLVKRCQPGLTFSELPWYSYNPIGKMLICMGMPDLKSYRELLKEIEETRQNVLAILK